MPFGSLSPLRRLATSLALSAALLACAGPAETLHKAALEGDAEKVQSVLAKNPDIVDHHQDPHGRTALHDAKNRQVAEALVAAGAKLTSQDKAGRLPIHTAKSAEVVDFLVEKGANPKDTWGPSGNTAMHSAVCAEAVEALLRHGVPANIPNAYKQNALFVNDSPEAITALVRAGLDPNARDKEGRLPIFSVTAPAITALIAAGADPNARDKEGITALHFFAHYGYAPEVEALLAGGADPNVRLPADAVLWDGHHQVAVAKIGNRTPLDLARTEAVRKALLKAGATQ